VSDNSNSFSLEGCKLVVTGGARGIGYAIARAAATAACSSPWLSVRGAAQCPGLLQSLAQRVHCRQEVDHELQQLG
jgi:NAD(P)-dependent dehydrogenase (short-subunit alcohol dehydrogenase family)